MTDTSQLQAYGSRPSGSVMAGTAKMGAQKEIQIAMLSKCANPRCQAPFRYMGEGRLFHLRRSLLRREDTLSELLGPSVGTSVVHYWLCHTCAESFDIVSGDGVGFRIIERRIRRAG